MQVLLTIFKFFAHGGAQRDMLMAAEALKRRNCQVTIHCSRADDPVPEGLQLKVLPAKGLSNHSRARDFERQAARYIKEHKFDVVVGFSRMSNLDILFAADDCLRARWKNPLLNMLLPRRKTFLEQEQAALKSPLILTLTGRQEFDYKFFYNIEPEKFKRLPPGISEKYRSFDRSDAARHAIRQRLEVAPEKFLIVQAAASFKTKGVDRTLAVISMLPDELKKRIVFIAAGGDKRRKNYEAAARVQNIDARFPGSSDTLEELFFAADLMVHPARSESAGNVLIEALCCNLPVLTGKRCGFAEYLTSSGSGVVLPEKFNPEHYITALKMLMTEPEHLKKCRSNAGNLYKSDFWYSRAEVIADEIINFARTKESTES